MRKRAEGLSNVRTEPRRAEDDSKPDTDDFVSLA